MDPCDLRSVLGGSPQSVRYDYATDSEMTDGFSDMASSQGTPTPAPVCRIEVFATLFCLSLLGGLMGATFALAHAGKEDKADCW
jgi:hypothetical protein